MKTLITTFPLGARKATPPLGILMCPVLADSLHKVLPDSKLAIVLNTMDSYKERQGLAKNFVDGLRYVSNVRDDQIWIDQDHEQELLTHVGTLERKGLVREEQTLLKSCTCGRIEMLESVSPHPDARFYSMNSSGGVSCKICSTPLTQNEANALTITYPSQILPTAYPRFMEKEIQQHQRDIDGSKFLVSRHDRDGPQYTASSGNKYTLDVDFCWLNYLSALADSDTENIYVVGSNHVAWHLSLATAIYNATNNAPANVTLVLPSYLTHPEGLDEIINGGYQQQEKFHNRALILSSLSWNDKNSQWNKHLPKKARCTPSTLNGELTNLPVQKVIPLITNRQNIVTYFAGKQEDNFLNSFYTKVLYGA